MNKQKQEYTLCFESTRCTDLVEMDDVWMSEQLHHLNFLNDSLQVLIIKLCFLNDLYSHLHRIQTSLKNNRLTGLSETPTKSH